jgi:hypothetical protein
MKFSAAALLLFATPSAAFAPLQVAAKSTAMHSTAEKSKTYTFAKSEEIFKEAQDVRTCLISWWSSVD